MTSSFYNSVIPCIASLGFFVLLFGFIAFMRYMSYRETLALAEKGLVRGQVRGNGSSKTTLTWGIIITALGLALSIGMYPAGFGIRGTEYPFHFGPWMLVGLLPMFFGLALILIYVLTREEKPKTEDKPKSETDKVN
jgi:hypothetical protein